MSLRIRERIVSNIHLCSYLCVEDRAHLESLSSILRAPYAKLVTPLVLPPAPPSLSRRAAAEQICRRPSEREIHS